MAIGPILITLAGPFHLQLRPISQLVLSSNLLCEYCEYHAKCGSEKFFSWRHRVDGTSSLPSQTDSQVIPHRPDELG